MHSHHISKAHRILYMANASANICLITRSHISICLASCLQPSNKCKSNIHSTFSSCFGLHILLRKVSLYVLTDQLLANIVCCFSEEQIHQRSGSFRQLDDKREANNSCAVKPELFTKTLNRSSEETELGFSYSILMSSPFTQQ